MVSAKSIIRVSTAIAVIMAGAMFFSSTADAAVSITVVEPQAPFVEENVGVHLVIAKSIGEGVFLEPSGATFLASGGTGPGDYEWRLGGTGAGGSIDTTSGTTVKYRSPSSITGTSFNIDTLTLQRVSDPADTVSIQIYVYRTVTITAPAAPQFLVAGGVTMPVTAAGGTGVFRYEITDSQPATGVASVDPVTGVVTATGAGTVKVRARDVRFGKFDVDNGFRSDADAFPSIAVLDGITIDTQGVIGLHPHQVVQFTASGGMNKGYRWSASDGVITLLDGRYTAPMVADAEYLDVTITAYDAVFNASSDNPIYNQTTVRVYGAVVVPLPEGYDAADASTWPLMPASGGTFSVSAAGGTGAYDWTATNTSVPGAAAIDVGSGPTARIDVDALFSQGGAGVYVVTARDAALPDLAVSSVYVRMPVRITPFNGSFTGANLVSFSVVGTDAVFDWVETGVSGKAVATGTTGTFAPQRGNTTNFDLGKAAVKLTGPANFRVKATTSDAALVDAGLGTAITDVLVAVPVYDLTITVCDAATGVGLAGAEVIYMGTGQTLTAADDTGAVTFTGLLETGGQFEFAAVKTGYYPKVITVKGISAPGTLKVNLWGNTGAATVGGRITPAGPGTTVQIFDDEGSPLKDGGGNPVTIPVDPASGAYTAQFAGTFTGPYDVVATRFGFVTNVFDQAGVARSVAIGANDADIAMVPETRIAVANQTTGPAYVTTISATPAFTGQTGEIAVFEGTDGTGENITSAFVFNQGVYTAAQAVSVPVAGQVRSIYVRADTSTTGRKANSGYFAERGFSVVAGLPDTPTVEGVINAGTGGTVQTGGGATKVFVPIGGVRAGGNVTVSITEIDNAVAGVPGIAGAKLMEINLISNASGKAVGDEDIEEVFITASFDPSVVPYGSLEDGSWVIYHADNLGDMMAGKMTPVPTSQIVPEVNYDVGRVMFSVSGTSVFGIGAASGSAAAGGGGGGGGGCFISTAGVLPRGGFGALMIGAIIVVLGVIGRYRRQLFRQKSTN